ncbi:hypothetical protein [Hankyongella ginsenosidimutans]|uniref:hypothetical protein n=1 Tax=Hankyongella ginsenosidimutans TaxID=1763828 RepID=UPI003CCC6378
MFHIHSGPPPSLDMPVTFALLLNLVSAANSEDPAVLWGFLQRHMPGVAPATHPELDKLVRYAVVYYRDRVAPAKQIRAATAQERTAIADFLARLEVLPDNADADTIQNAAFECGKANGYAENLRGWFQALYETLLGTSQGPRIGSFAALYGLPEMRALVRAALGRADV